MTSPAEPFDARSIGSLSLGADVGPEQTYELRGGSLDVSDLDVRVVRGREAMSECFRFDVDFSSDLEPEDVKSALFERSARLVIRGPGESPRVIDGIVCALREGGPELKHHRIFRMRLVPKLWLLRRGRNTRIFQDLSVVDIVKEILKGADMRQRWVLSHRHPALTYCVQYRESDYAFITRILAEAGIFFYFEPSPSGDDVDTSGLEPQDSPVFCDAVEGYTAIEHGAWTAGVNVAGLMKHEQGTSPSLKFRPSDTNTLGDDSFVSTFDLEQRLRAKSVTLREYNFKQPMASAEATTATRHAQSSSDSRFEVYEHHGEDEDPIVARANARTMLDRHRVDAIRAHAKSMCRRLAPGYRFTLDEHPDGAFNQEYVVVEIKHRGQSRMLVAPGDDAGAQKALAPGYENEFVCVPGTVPARPPVREREMQQVVEVATVTGPAGEEIYTDEFGRIKVQFPWDRVGQSNERSSCWMRVNQAWSGASWGAQFIPRIGMEVLVAFIGGDVDRPVVTGCLYNGTHPTPFELPKDKTRSGWRTQTTSGGNGIVGSLLAQGEAAVEGVLARTGAPGVGDLVAHASVAVPDVGDAMGQGHVPGVGGALAQEALSVAGGVLAEAGLPGLGGLLAHGLAGSGGFNELSFEDARGSEQIYIRAQRDLDELVLRNHTITVNVDETNLVSGNQSDTVHGHRVRVTHRNEHVTVLEDQALRVNGHRTAVVQGDDDTTVHTNRTLHVNGREHREITREAEGAYHDDRLERVRGSYTALVGRHDAQRSYVVHAEGTAQITGTSEVEIVSDKAIVLRCGKSSLRLTPEGIEISGTAVHVVGKDANLSVDDRLRLGTKGTATLLADSILLKSSQANVALGDDVKIDGTKVSLKSPVSAHDIAKHVGPTTQVALVDQDGKPIAHQRFAITMGDGSQRTGVTDKDGKAELNLDGSGQISFPHLTNPAKR